MRCVVEKIIPDIFSDEMYLFEFDLPENWEEFISDFKEIIGHTKNGKLSYFSKEPRKGWYLCEDRAKKAMVWALENFDEVIWCGETLKSSDSVSSGSGLEIDFMKAVMGNGIPKEKKIEVIKAVYRTIAKITHPDKGGDLIWMQKINVAYEQVVKSLGEP